MSYIPDAIIISLSYQSELEGIKVALKENDEVRVYQKWLFRSDLLRRVKQHSDMLSTVLQTFQVCYPSTTSVTSLPYSLQVEILLDVRLAQLIEGLKVCTLPTWIWINDVRLTSSIGHSWWSILLLPPF